MSEIIKDMSRVAPNWPAELECSACKSTIRVTVDDLTYDGWKTSGYWFDDSAVIEHVITWPCPACGHAYNVVSPSLLPVGIVADLHADYQARKAGPGGQSIV